MLLGLPKTEGRKYCNTAKSDSEIKYFYKLSNITVESGVIEKNKSNPNVKIGKASEEKLNLTSNRWPVRRTQSSSKSSCAVDFKADKNLKPSVQIIQKIREEKRNFEDKLVLADRINLLKLADLPCKNDLPESEELSTRRKVRENLYNFEIENFINCNEDPKSKCRLEYYTQCRSQNWQSQWKEFEADIKKEVRFLESLLKTNDHESLVKCGIEVLKRLNAFSASLKQKYPYRARAYYCLGKSYLVSGNYRESYKCSIELLRIGDILKDNKIIYSGYIIACKIYTKLRQYRQAAELWQKMISMEENLCERAKLYHKIGEWYFQLSEWEAAKSFGDLCLTAAVKVPSNEWCMKAYVLIGRSAMKLHNGKEALNALYNARHYKVLSNNGKANNSTKKCKHKASDNTKYRLL